MLVYQGVEILQLPNHEFVMKCFGIHLEETKMYIQDRIKGLMKMCFPIS